MPAREHSASYSSPDTSDSWDLDWGSARLEEAIAVAARRLRPVHCVIRVPQQGGIVVAVSRVYRNADADRQGQPVTRKNRPAAEGSEDFIQHLAGRAPAPNLCGNHHKLVTTQPCDGVLLPYTVAQAGRDLLEQPIARGVALPIIDGLKGTSINSSTRALL